MIREDLRLLTETLPFYSRLDQADQKLIADTATYALFAPKDMIMNREKECSGLVVVKSGQLRAYFETEDGKEITLYRLLSGDICILTASCVLKNISFEVMLEVEKESAVYFIPAAIFKKLSEKNAAVKEFSMELISGRFSEVMWVMEQMVSKNMGQRIAAFLLEQSALQDSDFIPMTHETIAKNLGTAREVVSRVLKYLENDRLIQLSRGQITLTDVKRLRAMSL